MKRKLLSIVASVIAVLLIAAPVLAAAIGTITAYNDSATSYTNLGFRIEVNNNALVTAGTLSADGLNAVVQSGGVNIPTMIADNATYFVSNISAYTGKTFVLSTNQTLSNHNIIPGLSGNVTVADAPNLALGGNFSVSHIGWVDTAAGANKYLINYPGSLTTNVTGTGNLTTHASVNATLTLLPTGNVTTGTFMTVVGASTSQQAVASNDNSTSYLAISRNGSGYSSNNTFSSNASSYTLNGTIGYVRLFYVTSSNYTMTPPTAYFQAVVQNVTDGGQTGVTNGVWNTHNVTYFTDPSGGSWNWAKINNLVFGVYCAGPADTNLFVSYIYVEVNYAQDQVITSTGVSSAAHNVTTAIESGNITNFIDGVRNGTVALNGTGIVKSSSNITILSANTTPYASNITISVNGTQQLWYSPNALISGTMLPDRAGGDNPGTINWGTFPVSSNISFYPSTNLALAPAYSVAAGPGFLGTNLTMSGNFTTANISPNAFPGQQVITDVSAAGGTPAIFLWGVLVSMFLVLVGLFISWMERKFGSTKEILLARIGIGAAVIGIMVSLGVFDWWMLFFYLVLVMTIYLFRDPEGNVEQNNLIGFLATSWIGLTFINRLMESSFLSSAETAFLNNFTFTRTYSIQGIVNIPILNLDFVNGLTHLFKWDYAFFGGNAQIIQYFLYSFTLVGSFIIFGMLIYAISGLFLRR